MAFNNRKAEAADIPALVRLMTELSGHPVTAQDMEHTLYVVENSQIEQLFVCEEDGKVLGTMDSEPGKTSRMPPGMVKSQYSSLILKTGTKALHGL